MTKWISWAGKSLVILALFSACSSDDEGGTVSITPPKKPAEKMYVAVNPGGDTDADISFVNEARGDMMIMDMSEAGLCKQIDIISEEKQAMQSVLFNADGLPASVVTENFVVSFANYNGNKVDIALSEGGNMNVYPEVECGANWDNIKASLANLSQNTSPSHIKRLSATDVALTIDKWLKDHNRSIVLAFDAVDKAMKGHSVVRERVADESYLINGVQDWVLPGLEELIDDNAVGSSSNVVLGTIETVADLVGAVAERSTYGVLKWVLTNYPAIEQKIEDGFYTLFTLLDDNKDNISLGQGALNSGYGSLKVTMVWNYYADVDLHAIEPSGTHIYYANRTSYETGGFLDVDNRHGGEGAVENIYWEEPEEGTYEIYIDWYSRSTLNSLAETGDVTVTILRAGLGQVFTIPLGQDETKDVATVTMPDGTIVEKNGIRPIRLRIPCKEKD